MFRTLLIVSVLFVFMFIIGCSGNSTPVSSDLSDSVYSSDNAVSDSLNRNLKIYPGLFGAWEVHINTQTLDYEIIPARNASAIGDIFDADLSQFLTVSPCYNCLKIPGIMIDSYEDLNIRIQMKHPFGDIAKRPDLHGFDVRAIFIAEQNEPWTFNAIKVMKPDGTEEPAVINALWSGLLNADGYTTHFDNIVNDDRYFPGGVDVPGNLNPFLRFFESYTTGPFDPHNPTGHNVMKVGAGFSEKVAVFNPDAASSGLTFYVIADVAYGQSAVLANRTNPQYYLPSFNRTEPWRVEYWMENNTLEGGNTTSTADIVVQVFDWQQGFSVDPSYPNPSNLSGIKESSNVSKVELAVPDMTDTLYMVTTPESGSGTPESPLQYRFTITNEKGIISDVIGLIAVRDELHGHASPSARMPIPTSPAGFPYETEDIRDYSMYFPIYVKFTKNAFPYYWDCNAINNELFIPWEEYYAPWGYMTLHPRYYSDLGHKKYQYRWDLDYDGVTFDIDASGLPSPELTFTKGGVHNVCLRVRTNSKPVHETFFTIPIYANGIAWDQNLFESAPTTALSSPQGQAAIAMTSDKFYFVSTREISNNREIWLSILDRAGNATSSQITNMGYPAYDPSIYVIESGTQAGIYVAFTAFSGSETYVYFTKGQLNGTGFTAPKRITSNSANIENRPIITYINDNLFIYYLHTTTIYVTYIASVHSTDYGDTWNENGSIVSTASDYQIDHSIATFTQWTPDLWMVWSDDINDPQTGLDLYTANTLNGLTFTGIRNISTIPGDVDEYATSTTVGNEEIAIAYLARAAGDTKSYAHLKIIHKYYFCNADWPVSDWVISGNKTFTRPCIATSGIGIYLISYGVFDMTSYELEARLSKFLSTFWVGRFDEYNIFHRSAGIVAPSFNGGQIYPCVATYKNVYTAAEGLYVYRDFTNGYVTSSVNPKMVFGDLNATYFASDGNKDY